ncbi:hypothetical protein LTS17_002166 [Exophiala oligosperma]
MPLARAKVPEYPRPVSRVPVDDIPICADTIVYYDEQSNEEIDSEQRAAKKRRIQNFATSYLRGEPIFIASAQLNGPFGKDWRNPWMKRRKSTTRTRSTKRFRPDAAVDPSLQPSKTGLDKQSRARGDRRTSQRYSQEDCNEIRKVEDWLRTSSFYEKAADRPILSPSPAVHSGPKPPPQKTKKWEPAPIPFHLSEVAYTASSFAKLDDVELHNFWPPLDQVQHSQATSSWIPDKKSPKISSPSITAFWPPVQQAHAQPQHIASTNLSNGENSRQHNLVGKSPPPRHRPETHSSEGVMKSNTLSTSLHTALERPPSHAHDSKLPALSSASSKFKHTDDLPSAQIQIQPALHSVPSNLSSNIQIFTAAPDHQKTSVQEQKEPQHADEEAVKMEEENPNDRLKSPLGTPTRSGGRNKVIPAESQSPVHKVTKSITKKKRTTFVTEERSSGSSQGSIKMAMKVAKPSALNQDKTTKIQSGANADSEESPRDNVTEMLSPPPEKPIRGMSERKGILKSSLVTSTEAVASITSDAQIFTNQDAQRPAKLKAIESATSRLKDDDFDVEGAIDDLGSFLGTWDQQQEAVGLKASG